MSEFHTEIYGSDHLVPASGTERLAAAAAHGALALASPFLLPVVIFFLYPIAFGPSAYVRHQSLQAALFHLFFMFLTTMFGTATVFFLHILIIGWPFALVTGLLGGAFGVWGVIVMVIATWRSFQGLPYRMPVVGNFSR